MDQIMQFVGPAIPLVIAGIALAVISTVNNKK